MTTRLTAADPFPIVTVVVRPSTAGWNGSEDLPVGLLDPPAPPVPRAPWWRRLLAWCGATVLQYLGTPR